VKRIGIAGATGLVGETMLRVVEPLKSGVEEVRLFASERSAGTEVVFRDHPVKIRELDAHGFEGLDVAFFCVGNELSARLVPRAAKLCPVIDKSSHFRLAEGVPLVVPEVNPQALEGHQGIIANPNCTTIPLCVAIGPLAVEFGLEALHVATYQSVSGAGRDALEQLDYETEFAALGQNPDPEGSPFPGRMAHNLIPQIGAYDRHGNAGEESKLIHETRKILGLPGLKVSVTCVRVPVRIGHSLAVCARFGRSVKPKQVLGVLKGAAGVAVTKDDEFMTPVECEGDDNVYVSRVRQGADPEEINMWIVTDNLRKGAAVNALQIAQLLFEED
jgi:aspartate-semialdehyde dehydrogenase